MSTVCLLKEINKEIIYTSAWTTNPEGGNNEGRVASGASSPGQIQIMPSCSKQGKDRIRTSTSRVDGIFLHFPSVEYSHPDAIHEICEKLDTYSSIFKKNVIPLGTILMKRCLSH